MSAVVYVITVLIGILLAFSIGSMIWRGIYRQRFSRYLFLFAILPISQLLMIQGFGHGEWHTLWVVGLLLGLSANILLLIYIMAHDKMAAVTTELQETRHKIALEQSHYQAIGQRRTALADIRKDFNKKLADVAYLVQSGKDDSARDLISDLADKIKRTKENMYCTIPVVNAVLTEKARVCMEAGITLQVELDMPTNLTVEPLHLCSIFSNLLDNAIAACKKIVAEVKPIIRLSSLPEGDYIFIKTINPSDEPTKPAPGRGYGKMILSEIATQYNGSYQAEYRDGCYTAIIALLAIDGR